MSIMWVRLQSLLFLGGLVAMLWVAATLIPTAQVQLINHQAGWVLDINQGTFTLNADPTRDREITFGCEALSRQSLPIVCVAASSRITFRGDWKGVEVCMED